MSLIECGRADRVAFRTLARVLAALEAEASIQVRWRGGELDRVLDEGHARLAEEVARRLAALGWLVQAEVSYAFGSERGSIDLTAFHPIERRLLIIEIKSELTSVEATLRKHDEKARLGRRVARERLGWDATDAAGVLALPRSTTARRRIAEHAALFDRSYPLRGAALGRWLRRPASAARGGLLFVDVPLTSGVGDKRALSSRRRVRTGSARSIHAPTAPIRGGADASGSLDSRIPPTILVGGASRR